MVERVVGVGKCTGANTDKFKKFNLITEPAAIVAAPLLAECYANIECKVVDTTMVSKYNLFILQAVKAWKSTSKKQPKTLHHWGNGLFSIDGKTIKLPFKSTEPVK